MQVANRNNLVENKVCPKGTECRDKYNNPLVCYHNIDAA